MAKSDCNMKTRWLCRDVGEPGPHMCLCLNEREFIQALRELKIKERPKFTRLDAKTHICSAANHIVAIVCLRDHDKHSGIQVASLLVHEAVHVWQEYLDMIGEDVPGKEIEAYGIQAISQTLMEEFERRLRI